MSREWERFEDTSIKADDVSEQDVVVESQIDRFIDDLAQCRQNTSEEIRPALHRF
jgi:hypothetical protein